MAQNVQDQKEEKEPLVFASATSGVEHLLNQLGYAPENQEVLARLQKGTLDSNPELRAQLNTFQTAHILDLAKRDRTRKEVYISCVTNAQDLMELQEEYPRFKLIFSNESAQTAHGYARASRYLDQYEILSELKYKDDAFIPDGYDVLVKEFGANIPFLDKLKYSNVHACCPTMDHKDLERAYDRRRYVQQHMVEALAEPKEHPHVHAIATGDTRLFCEKPGQACAIRAPVCFANHAIYDFNAYTLGVALDSAGCVEFHATFLYDAHMSFCQEGHLGDRMKMSWKRGIMIGGKEYVKYAFLGETSFHYLHDYKWIDSLVHGSSEFVTPSGRRYSVVRHKFSNYTMYLKFFLLEKRPRSREVLTRSVPVDPFGSVVVQTYNLDTVGPKVTRIFLVVPRWFFAKVDSFCAGIKNEKFTTQQLMTGSLAFNNRTIAGGQSGPGPNLTSTQIRHLVVAVYMMNYIKNYEMGQLIKILKQDEDELRSIGESGFVRYCFKAFFRAFGGGLDTPLQSSAMTVEFAESLSKDENKNLLKEGIFRRLAKFISPKLQRKFPIDTFEPRVIEDVEVLKSLICKPSEEIPIYNAIERVDVITLAKLTSEMSPDEWVPKEAGADKYVVRQLTDDYLSKLNVHNHECCETLTRCDIPGDGNCFYHCLIRALDLQLTPDDLRKSFRESEYVYIVAMKEREDTFASDPAHVRELIDRLQPLSHPTDQSRWANLDVVRLAALFLNLPICLHVGQICMLFDPLEDRRGFSIHLSLIDGHYELLEPAPCSDISFHTSLERDEARFGEFDKQISNVENSLADFSNLPTVLKAPNRSAYAHSVVNASMNSSPFRHVRNARFSNYYGAMLTTALDKCIGSLDGHLVLDIDQRNKCSAKVLLSYGAEVVAFSLCREHAYATGVRNVFRTSSELVDLGLEVDDIVINPRAFSDLIFNTNFATFVDTTRETLHSLINLKPGGSLVIAIPTPFPHCVATLLWNVLRSFSTVEVCYTDLIPDHTMWTMCVFKGYSGHAITYEEQRFSDMFYQFVSDVRDIGMTRCDNSVMRIREFIDTGKTVSFNPRIGNRVKEFYRSELIGGGLITDLPNLDPRVTARVAVTATLDSLLNSERVPAAEPGSVAEYLTSLGFPVTRQTFQDVLDDFSRNYAKEQLLAYGYHSLDETIASKISLDIVDLKHSHQFVRKYLLALIYEFHTHKKTYVSLQIPYSSVRKTVSTDHFFRYWIHGKFFLRLNKIKHELRVLVNKGTPAPPVMMPKAPQRIINYANDVVSTIGRVFQTDNQKVQSAVRKEETREMREEFDERATKGGWLDDSYADGVIGNYEPYVREYFNYLQQCVDTVTSLADSLGKVVSKVIVQKSVMDYLKVHLGLRTEDAIVRLNGRYYQGNHDALKKHRFALVWSMGSLAPCLIEMKSKDDFVKASKSPNIFTFDELKVFSEKRILDNLEDEIEELVKYPVSISITQAGPGAGKTHSIVTSFVKDVRTRNFHNRYIFKSRDDLPAVRAKAMARLNIAPHTKEGKDFDSDFSMLCTSIDSVLISQKLTPNDDTSLSKVNTVHVDEAMIHHPGKIVTCAAILGADTVRCYGDIFQIPFIDRSNSDTRCEFAETGRAFAINEFLRKSYRCTDQVCKYLCKYYVPLAVSLKVRFDSQDELFYSASGQKGSYSVVKINSVQDVVAHEASHYLTFTQAEKNTLKCALPKNAIVNTIHEFQGLEGADTIIVRTNPHASLESSLRRPDGTYDNMIYDSQAHIVSGISRHTKSLRYLTVVDNDTLSHTIRALAEL